MDPENLVTQVVDAVRTSSFTTVESLIEALAIPDDHKAALWLLAWSMQSNASREALTIQSLMIGPAPIFN